MADRDSLTLDAALAERLAAAADARGKSTEAVAAEAIAAYLDWDDDFRAAVSRGVAEADAGHFASDHEIAHVFRKRI
jgi:predicted transcriptional regulator